MLSIAFCFNVVPAGLAFGLLGLARYRTDHRKGASASSAALVCSAIGSTISALLLLFLAGAIAMALMTTGS